MIPKKGNTSEKQEDVKLTSDDVGEAGAMKSIQGQDQAAGESDKSWWSKFPTFLKSGKEAIGETSKSKLNTAFIFIQNQNTTLRNVLVAATTYGLERLLNAKAFHCPEKNYKQYGFAFLFAPVVILFCANVLAIGEIWKLSSRMFVKRYRRRGDCVARVLPSLLKSCAGPAVWLIVVFQEKDYYLCARLGPLTPSNNETLSEQQIVKSEAQVLSWFVFGGLMIFGTALIVWKKCYFKDNLLMENHYSFERREALSARIAFTKLAGGTLCKDADIDDDPTTAEYGSKEDRVTLHHDGVPELIGKKTVEKLFEGYKGADWTSGDKWHYIKAYEAFKQMYPRISTGSPLHPWRAIQGDGKQTSQRLILPATSSQKTSSTDEIEPLYQYGDDKNLQTSKQEDLTKKEKQGDEEHGMDRGNGISSVSLSDKESSSDESELKLPDGSK